MQRYHDATCRDCGDTFKSTGSTVRCKPCRAARANKQSDPDGHWHWDDNGRKVKGYKPIACGRCGHVHTTLRCDSCGF